MSNGTISAILGTVIGLGAGVGGMIAFGHQDDGAAEDFTAITKRNTDLNVERDELEGQLAGMDKQLKKLQQELENERKVSNDLLNERDDNPNAEAADASKAALEAKDDAAAKAEALRIANAKLSKYEALLLENGIYEFLTPERREELSREFKATFETAIAGKSKAEAMKALQSLQMLGPKYFDDSIKLWEVMAADFGVGKNWENGPSELGMSMQEFVSLVPSFELIEYALKNPDAALKFRESMLYGLEWRTDEDANKRTDLAGNILLANNAKQSAAAIYALQKIDAPGSVRYLSEFVSGNTDDTDGRKAAIAALQSKGTDAAWAAIESAAKNDSDPDVRKSAAKALATRSVSVAGVQITFVDENAQAGLAGIKIGDIMTSYNGKPVRKLGDVNAAKASVKEGQSVIVELYRDGKPMKLTVGPGTIGINGIEVKPKE
ncbi:PDZ domain-containing protein [Planctomycetota bacterium]|nr:PDZ domain-containing protein [Planctomycetota bacterium]